MDSYILEFVLADVIANDFEQLGFVYDRCYCHVANDFGQLSFVYGRCYCHVALFYGRCYTTGICCNLFYMVVVMLLPPG